MFFLTQWLANIWKTLTANAKTQTRLSIVGHFQFIARSAKKKCYQWQSLNYTWWRMSLNHTARQYGVGNLLRIKKSSFLSILWLLLSWDILLNCMNWIIVHRTSDGLVATLQRHNILLYLKSAPNRVRVWVSNPKRNNDLQSEWEH